MNIFTKLESIFNKFELIADKLAMLAGIVLIAMGLYGLFIPRLTSDDGALLISGAVLFGIGLAVSSRRRKNAVKDPE